MYETGIFSAANYFYFIKMSLFHITENFSRMGKDKTFLDTSPMKFYPACFLFSGPPQVSRKVGIYVIMAIQPRLTSQSRKRVLHITYNI